MFKLINEKCVGDDTSTKTLHKLLEKKSSKSKKIMSDASYVSFKSLATLSLST